MRVAAQPLRKPYHAVGDTLLETTREQIGRRGGLPTVANPIRREAKTLERPNHCTVEACSRSPKVAFNGRFRSPLPCSRPAQTTTDSRLLTRTNRTDSSSFDEYREKCKPRHRTIILLEFNPARLGASRFHSATSAAPSSTTAFSAGACGTRGGRKTLLAAPASAIATGPPQPH